MKLYLCSYAESVGAKHYHTSAKLNKGIEELFLDLCKSKPHLKCKYCCDKQHWWDVKLKQAVESTLPSNNVAQNIFLGMMETAQAEERLKGNGASQSASNRRGVQIVDDEPQATPAGGCCSSG